MTNAEMFSGSKFGNKMNHLLSRPSGHEYLESWQKRALDITGSVLLIPIVAPIIAGSALVVILEDGLPGVIAIDVVGKGRKNFGLYKLRTMNVGGNQEKNPLHEVCFHKSSNDPRVTRAGRIFRKLSIDELPQLINILRGEMSLVGDRPMFKERVDKLGSVEKLSDLYEPWIKTLDHKKPGLLGLLTFKGRSSLDETEQGTRNRLRYEAFYAHHASLGFDLKIIAETIKTILSGNGGC